jgi:hypothetical protein
MLVQVTVVMDTTRMTFRMTMEECRRLRNDIALRVATGNYTVFNEAHEQEHLALEPYRITVVLVASTSSQ